MIHVYTLAQSFLKTHDDWRVQLMVQWPHIIGDLAQHVCIQKIEHDTITLGVPSAAWMHELHALSDALRSRINNALDRPRINKIRFKYANRTVHFARQVHQHYQPKPAPRQLTAKEECALNRVIDQELRTQLHNFLQRCSQK